ncbi:hypothetical protein CCR75_000897 [Bremia lactucae]|uniref:Uncharacterized protein n=1 Tax=Bremia lactucae TaxID=4779 RepID=A0A976IFL9_BRELC|nr:hypothetical protein CCR75_000897 [Bremia lactucae]
MPSLKLLGVVLAMVHLAAVNATYMASERKSFVSAFYANPDGRRLVEVKPVSWLGFGTYASTSENRRLGEQNEEERIFGMSGSTFSKLAKEPELLGVEDVLKTRFGDDFVQVFKKNDKATKAMKDSLASFMKRSKAGDLTPDEVGKFANDMLAAVKNSKKWSKKKKFVLGAGVIAAFILVAYAYNQSKASAAGAPTA